MGWANAFMAGVYAFVAVLGFVMCILGAAAIIGFVANVFGAMAKSDDGDDDGSEM